MRAGASPIRSRIDSSSRSSPQRPEGRASDCRSSPAPSRGPMASWSTTETAAHRHEVHDDPAEARTRRNQKDSAGDGEGRPMTTAATSTPTVLVIDDEMGILDTIRILLKSEGFIPYTALGGKKGLEQIAALRPDLIITDVRMPDVTGLDILASVRAHDPDAVVILMTAQASLQSAIGAVNNGAFYYIQKPFRNEELVAIVRRAAEHRTLKRENKTLKVDAKRRDRSGKPIGASRTWLDALHVAESVAGTDSTVLLQGESGTGKEVVARYIHDLSPRAPKPFLSINCGALPESLLESELFGHVKGSFTGASRDKEGLFSAAGEGTFFLDEIGETTPATQVKLLRVLQQREVIPVGATEAKAVNARVIAATNRDLEDEIKRGNFRS